MKAIIVVERDGWTWRIEPQDGSDSEGVDIVYQEGDDKHTDRTCIGTWDDAQALAEAILAYVKFARKHNNV